MIEKSLPLTSAGNSRSRTDSNGSSSSPQWNHHQRSHPPVPRPLYSQLADLHLPEEEAGICLPWRLFEERVRSGPFGLFHFPSLPHAPARILIIDGNINGEIINPQLRQFIRESPPRISREWRLSWAPEPEDPGLTETEFKKAMKKLRKQTYDPPLPKKKEWKRGLFPMSNSREQQVKTDEKLCSVCLEEFEAGEQVLMTPCDHMFHYHCLVPWVKSHGKCPVCRLKLCDREEVSGAQRSSYNSSSSGSAVGGDDLVLELLALVRAMEEAFAWINLSHN
ncbi:E3 ubiquitin-protein ligase RING1 [Apostasia shenzhenica]|uniref:RING-type E3 ubiquitin transferase n=1 Tax=Apostasia shenzhenica TaxID=1088818 RepID=A0A2I0B9Y7_9ASPA|nr:E3 ubiquitin-protein ligase RING1 [Apostasia shenzhenica]